MGKAPKPTWADTLAGIKRPKGWQATAPTVQRFKDFSGLLGIFLPQSYREFSQRLGAGQLSAWCDFYSCAAGLASAWDMFHQNLNHSRLVLQAGDRADKRARRLILFGGIWSNDAYGWDVDEVTSGKKQPEEYAIYTVDRFMRRTTKLADTFPEFISDFCTGDGLPAFLQLDEPIEKPRNDYSPRP